MTIILGIVLIGILVLSVALGGPGGLITGVILDVILILFSVRIVSPNTVKLVERLGKFSRILEPGFHLIIPFIEWTRNQVLYRRNFEVEVEGVTSDKVTAYIGLNVIYYVEANSEDVYQSVYSIDDPRTMMRASIDEQLRAMITSFTHFDIFSKREEIGEAIDEKLRVKLKQFGYRLDSIQVRDVKLDSTVMTAMNRIIEAEKLREAALNEAEAQKIKQVKEAEAEKESKILIGQGMAGQRMEIAKGFQESVEMIKGADSSLDGQAILKFLLDSSRIETLGNIGHNGNSKLIYLNDNLEGSGGSKLDKLVAGSDIVGSQK